MSDNDWADRLRIMQHLNWVLARELDKDEPPEQFFVRNVPTA